MSIQPTPSMLITDYSFLLSKKEKKRENFATVSLISYVFSFPSTLYLGNAVEYQ